jgi:ATP-dependent protease Clp ATPase subunit
MKKLLFSLILLASLQTQAQKYFTKTGTIIFNSKSPVEKIEGVNKATACLLDTRTGAIDFIVQKAMEFKLGARGLRSICEAIMTDLMYELPSSTSEEKEFKITADYAQKQFNQSSIADTI